MIENASLNNALAVYCNPNVNIQAQEHIKPIHYYSAIRLVLEGGFEPENILPKPPFTSTKQTLEKYKLLFSPDTTIKSEATVLGGLRTKQIDITVRSSEAGPTLGISLKTTNNAFRNIPNRVEELLGDVTNIHIRYPAFVYGFCHIIKLVRENEALQRNDASFSNDNNPVPAIEQFHDLLTGLVGRSRLTDRPEQYESVALLVVECTRNGPRIFPNYPPTDSPVHFSKFFDRLYKVYDERYCYVGADKTYCRKNWVLSNDNETTTLDLASLNHEPFSYQVRLWE